MPKYIAVLDINNEYDAYGDSIYRGAIGIDYLEIDADELGYIRADFKSKSIILLEVVDSPQVLLEQIRKERAERKEKEKVEAALEELRRAEAREKRRQKAEALRLKKEQQQLEAARKLLREKGELPSS